MGQPAVSVAGSRSTGKVTTLRWGPSRRLASQGSPAPPFRGQTMDQRHGLPCLGGLVEEPIGTEPTAEVLVFGMRVIGEDHLDRLWRQAVYLQRLQHVESAAGGQADVDEDKVGL